MPAFDVQHIPYKGSVEIVPSIIAGDTQFAFPIASTAIPQVQGGKVRALAVSSAQRMPALSDVPTLVEALNAPELAVDAWFGLWAPAGTPAPVVDARVQGGGQGATKTARCAPTPRRPARWWR